MPNGTGDGGPSQDEPAISIVNTISLIVVFGYLSFMPLWMFHPPKGTESVLAIINQMMGAWGYAFAAVIGYHLGSSKSSKEAQRANRETMATLATTAATAATTAAVVAGVPVAPLVPGPGVQVPPANVRAVVAGQAEPTAADGVAGSVNVEGNVTVTDAPEGATEKSGANEARG